MKRCFFVGCTKLYLPALRGANQVVRGLEAPRLLPATPVDAPQYVGYRMVCALINELSGFKVCMNEAFVCVDFAQRDHVLCNGLPAGPVRVGGVLGDARWHCVEFGDRVPVQGIEGVSVVLEEGSDLVRHGVHCWSSLANTQRLGFVLRNVEVTGAARLYRAASG